MSKHFLAAIGLLTVCICNAEASPKITFYNDHAMAEVEGTAKKSIVEIPLPASANESSIRIKPLNSAVIKRVDIINKAGHAVSDTSDDRLSEQKNRLLDRLKALDTREKIFVSAAKSQSGKAPRKSKSNPDPMLSIRQGTDFAIAQLEAVYTAKRKTEAELRKIEAKIAVSKNGATTADGQEKLIRVQLASLKGSVMVSYRCEWVAWQAKYDFHFLGNGTIAANLYAVPPPGFSGFRHFVTIDSISSALLKEGEPLMKASLRTDYKMEAETMEPLKLISNHASYLPPGEATLYRKGEYFGKAIFTGLSSSRSTFLKRK